MLTYLLRDRCPRIFILTNSTHEFTSTYIRKRFAIAAGTNIRLDVSSKFMTSTILRREQRKKNSRRENTARTEEVKFATQKEPRPFSLEFRCNISKGQRRKYLHLVKRIRLCFIPVIPGSESTHERSYIREKQSVASMYTLSPEQRIY